MICNACRAGLRTARANPLRTIALRASSVSSSTSSPSSRLIAAITLQSTSFTRSFSASRTLRSVSATIDEELPSMSPAESAIAELLAEKLSPTQLLVQDVSGGCGSMYAIDITSPAFRGQTILKQQRMVNAALGDLVKGWHGVQIRTKVPAEDA
ncbi:bola protein [Ilyonectria robusta]|uniref:bola protein n=1 Tax=Ilyonectria robusta TaxID=1079257 RepID=UPI001E8CEEED|nr:bola protein [Ilyonectria robusta]KAH8738211.1 bola protein [Ilyonectria robusta]